MIFSATNRPFFILIGLGSFGILLCIIAFLEKHPFAKLLAAVFLIVAGLLYWNDLLQNPANSFGALLIISSLTLFGCLGSFADNSGIEGFKKRPFIKTTIISAILMIVAIVGLYIVNNPA